jgi:hypothetical protein
LTLCRITIAKSTTWFICYTSPCRAAKQRAFVGAGVRRAVRGVRLNNRWHTLVLGIVGLVTFSDSGLVSVFGTAAARAYSPYFLWKEVAIA